MSSQGRTMADTAVQKKKEAKHWAHQKKVHGAAYATEAKEKCFDKNKDASEWMFDTGRDCKEGAEDTGNTIGDKMSNAYEKTKETVCHMFKSD